MLPSNLLAEEALIGAFLFDPRLIALVGDRLPPEAFFLEANQKTYKACGQLVENGQIDLHKLATVTAPNDYDKTLVRLTTMMERVIGSGDVEHHLKSVLDAWRRRRFITLANDIVSRAKDLTSSVPDVQAFVEKEITDICQDVSQSNVISLAEAVEEFRSQLHQPHNALPLMIPEVDRLLSGGLRPKTFSVIAARPSMGKTWVGNFIASAIAGAGDRPAVIFSAEMPRDQLASRFLATASNINLGAIMERRMSDEEVARLYAADFSRTPIHIDDTDGASLTTSHILTQCQKIRREHGSVGVVVVDYLQLLGDRGSNNRHGEVGKFSSFFVSLSKQLDCPVVALAQLNRGVEGRQDKRPMLSDLKESGDIEQDASVVVFLYREDYYSDDKPRSGEWVNLDLIFAKNRNGQCGTASVSFCPATGAIAASPPITEY